MPDALEEFTRQTIAEILKKLSLEERLKGLPAEELLKGISLKERVKGLSADEVLAALSPEMREELARRLIGNDPAVNPS